MGVVVWSGGVFGVDFGDLVEESSHVGAATASFGFFIEVYSMLN